MTVDTSKALVGDLIAADRIPKASIGLEDQGKNEQEEDKDQLGRVGNGQDAPPEGSDGQPTDEDNQPQDLSPQEHALRLTGDEIDVLTRLSPFLGGSPRRARRFVNVYRVAKASLTPVEVRALEQGEYRALATQLAIATGAPNAFSSWIDICENLAAGSIEEQFAKLSIDDDERGNISGALHTYDEITEGTAEGRGQLAIQGARASRFSFAIPRKQRLATLV